MRIRHFDYVLSTIVVWVVFASHIHAASELARSSEWFNRRMTSFVHHNVRQFIANRGAANAERGGGVGKDFQAANPCVLNEDS